MTPDAFARILANDLGIRTDAFLREVSRQIDEQLQALRTVGPIPVGAEQRVRIKVECAARRCPAPARPAPKRSCSHVRTVFGFPFWQLDITVDHICLQDQFEWTLGTNQTEPEAFADVLTNELGLSGEFRCVSRRATSGTGPGGKPDPRTLAISYNQHMHRAQHPRAALGLLEDDPHAGLGPIRHRPPPRNVRADAPPLFFHDSLRRP